MSDAVGTSTSIVGSSVVIERAFTQDELSQFGRLSCDDHPIHVDPDFARASGLPGTIVQGSLILGLMAGASTALFQKIGRPALSYGYDRLRFTKPASPGELLSVAYAVVEHDLASGKVVADVKVTTGAKLVAVATHLAKLL